ncbi:MAG: GNAT family N-acetyltransferase [Aggregatilineales bacterium]
MSAIFETDRVRLTAFTDDDLPQFAAWLSDFELQRLVNPGISMLIDVDDLLNPEGWFQQSLKSDTSCSFAVRTQPDSVFIGSCALVNRDSITHTAEIGINIAHPDYRGKGYGREIMLLLMHYGFEQWHLNRIYLKVMSFNARAMHLYENLGFQHEVREREILFHNGQYFDALHMGILKSEWEATHAHTTK